MSKEVKVWGDINTNGSEWVEKCQTKKEDNFEITLMKTLRRIKDKYYKDSETYFDKDLEELEKKYNEVQND